MMVAVFATMTLALILGWFGRRSLAVELFAACLVLSIGLFLFEIYSPEYGFGCLGFRLNFISRLLSLRDDSAAAVCSSELRLPVAGDARLSLVF